MKEIIRYTGPYVFPSGKNVGRQFMTVYYSDGSRGTTLYSRYLYQKEHNVILNKNITVDHVDENKGNGIIDNLQPLSRIENIKKNKLANPEKTYEFICPICFNKAVKKLRNVKHNLKQGKAGPFCGKKCARRYQIAGMAKSEVAVDLKSTILMGV